MRTHQGVLAVVTNAVGHVQGTGVDFYPSGAGGFDARSRQADRALSRAWEEAIRRHCSQAFADALVAADEHLNHWRGPVRELTDNFGWHSRVTDVEVEVPGDD